MFIRSSIVLSLVVAASASATISSVDLSQYQLAATYDLASAPFFPASSESSGVTYNWDNGNLFIVGDEGDAILEITPAGQFVSTMTLTGFADTEGLTYIGGGQFVVGEERLQDVYKFTYTAGGSADRGSLQTASIGPTVGNIGIEGFSYDPRNGRFVMVKEKSPQGVYDTAITFTNPPAAADINPTNLFNPALLGVLDISDVQVLATVPSLIGTADEDNLLIFSQESARLLEVTRTGQILSTFSFSGINATAEGVTIGPDGTIYIVAEELSVASPTPVMYVLRPIPAPGAAALVGLVGLSAARRRRTA